MSDGVDYETRLQQITEARALASAGPAAGWLLGHLSNPLCVRRAKQLLTQLCEKIATRGPDWDEDSRLLTEIYGLNPLEKPPNFMFQIYAALAKAGNHPELAAGISFEPGEGPKVLIDLLKIEIQHCERLVQAAKASQDRRKGGQKKAPMRLPVDWYDRFLRPETHLSRELDRTQSQLERLQRMRWGQPAPPEIKVSLSS